MIDMMGFVQKINVWPFDSLWSSFLVDYLQVKSVSLNCFK